jgi:hypothetical protein
MHVAARLYYIIFYNFFSVKISSQQLTHCEAYDISESESEDEDVTPRPISSAAPSEASSDITLEDQEHKVAIEADPRREKAFKIATELLTTERSYVAVLHLIDQVILQGVCVYLSCFSIIVLEVFVTV